jgi:hypothetical protein
VYPAMGAENNLLPSTTALNAFFAVLPPYEEETDEIHEGHGSDCVAHHSRD